MISEELKTFVLFSSVVIVFMLLMCYIINGGF